MGGHTMSHPGYLPDCLVDRPRCVLLKVTFFQMSSERGAGGGGGTSLQNSCIDELSST